MSAVAAESPLRKKPVRLEDDAEQPLVLQVHDLKRHYEMQQGFMKPKNIVRALNGVSFELRRGKTLAIVGESGSGKSTLARQLTLIDEPSGGQIIINGIDVAQASKAQRKSLRTQVQMVFQNPYASLNPRQKIGQQLAEPLLINTTLSTAEREQHVNDMLLKVGLLPEHARRYPHMFSGGQRQRIAIARAMMLKPNILVADEPTSALDVSIQAQVLNLFMDLQQELHTAYVFISHNLAVVHHIADDVMVMYKGRIVEYGPKEVVYAQPLHPYTQTLLAASPSLRSSGKKNKNTTQGNPRRNYAYATQDGQPEPELHFIQGRLVACHDPQEIIGATVTG